MKFCLNSELSRICFFLMLCTFITLGCEKKSSIELGKQTLETDTTWQGNVLITGDIYVPPGVTLTVAPGTIVKFKRVEETMERNLFALDSPYYPVAEIIVRGRLIANGTKDNHIVFTSAEVDARPGDWGALNLLGSDDHSVKYAKVLFAFNGIHAHGSTGSITHCEFASNGVGISFKSEEENPDVPWFGKRSKFIITDNLFHRNKGGVGLRNSDGEIMHNEIRDNKFFGVWPKENVGARISYNEITGNKKGVLLYQTQGVTLTNNNIYDNKDYEIAVATAQDYPVEAPNNWFGTINKQKIEELIFDQKDDPDLGAVLFEPYLHKPVEWERP